MKQGRWVKRDLWLPHRIKDIYGCYHNNPPAGIVTWAGHEVFIHREVIEENPDYPVVIYRIGQAMYGARLRSLEIRHAYLRNEREQQWWDYIQCRVMP
jgi:hypothetical protein